MNARVHLHMAFTTLHPLVRGRPVLRQLCRPRISAVSPISSVSPLAATQPTRCMAAVSFAAARASDGAAWAAPQPRALYASALTFDKVPTKLPDWWDDEDEDEEGEEERAPSYDGGDGGGGGSGSGGGGGSGDRNGREPNDDDPLPANIFSALAVLYSRALTRHPIPTKSLSAAILAILGDYIAQRIAVESNAAFSWDRRRTLAIGTWGFFVVGPMLHIWYLVLSRTVTGRYSLVRKLLADQLLFSPPFNALFIMGTSVLEGLTFRDAFERTRSKMWAAQQANWMLWPAAQAINFTFVPQNLQTLFTNCVAVLWNVILTYLAHDEEE